MSGLDLVLKSIDHLEEEMKPNWGKMSCPQMVKHCNNFIQVYIKCSLDSCEKRDVRGMYKKARVNEINNFIGIHVNYEPPTNPELIIDTENSTVDHNVQIILDYLKENKMIKN